MTDDGSDVPLPDFSDSGSDGIAEPARDRAALDKAEDVGRELERLKLICEAMWEVVKARTGAADDELIRLIEEIDLRDGRLNGKSASIAQACTQCGRMVSSRSPACLYCGTRNLKTSIF